MDIVCVFEYVTDNIYHENNKRIVNVKSFSCQGYYYRKKYVVLNYFEFYSIDTMSEEN